MHHDLINAFVAPYAGAWIEIRNNGSYTMGRKVAPYAGAWIEIYIMHHDLINAFVAPYAGAWIEISICRVSGRWLLSHPTRVRGLKSNDEEETEED